MEKIGHATCQPIGDCGSGTWGNIKTTASTIYVDQGHRGAGGKGTKDAPFKTIGEALKQAAAGAHIAVASGTYLEQVSIVRKVKVEGRCSQQVIIDGGIKNPTVEMKGWSTGGALGGVTITGAGVGVWINGVDVTLANVALLGCAMGGIQVEGSGTLTIRDSLVAKNRDAGIFLYSSSAILERSVVRDSREIAADSRFGVGIQLSVATGKTQPSQLTLRDSLVSGNRTLGISVFSSKLTMERSVVRDTLEQLSDKMVGSGIRAMIDIGQTAPSELIIRDSLIAGNRKVGLNLASTKATMERTVVRDTRARAKDGAYGIGINLLVQPQQNQPSLLTLRDSLVAGNRTIGLNLDSSKATLERTVVRDTLAQLSDNTAGVGVQALPQSSTSILPDLTIRDSVIANNRYIGLALESAKGTLERIVVRDTRVREKDSKAGVGILASQTPGLSSPTSLTVQDSLVAGNHTVGLILASTKATIERTVVRGTRAQMSDMRGGVGLQASVQPGQTLPSALILRESLIEGNKTAGVLLSGSDGTISRCAVLSTGVDGHRQWGDGIVSQSFSTGAGQAASLAVEDTVVARNHRAGLLYIVSGGSVRRSLISKNVFAIAVEHGASPVIGDDNHMVDNQVNRVSFGRGLKAPPIASIPRL